MIHHSPLGAVPLSLESFPVGSQAIFKTRAVVAVPGQQHWASEEGQKVLSLSSQNIGLINKSQSSVCIVGYWEHRDRVPRAQLSTDSPHAEHEQKWCVTACHVEAANRIAERAGN